jgi:calcineurin-like phosphoesterase family protein
VKRLVAGVLFLLLGFPATAAAEQAQLEDILQNVPGATAYRYGVKDNLGNSMDTLKIIDNPQGGYLGVYHVLVGGVFQVKLATSSNLLNWTFRTDLASNGSQPSIAALTDKGFLLMYEQDAGCTGLGLGGRCLRFLHYPTVAALLVKSPDRSFQAPRTLSRCAEGTPNLYFATLSPDIAHSTIRVGFHYFRDCNVDRQAAGTLTNFSQWGTWVTDGPNAAIEAAGAVGHIGDRDAMFFVDTQYRLTEGQLVRGDNSSWRPFLFSWLTGAKRLNVRTHAGSTSFANPTFTQVKSPTGYPAVAVTMFLPMTGSAGNEAGELVYWKKLTPDPVIAAAGDIVCGPGSPGYNGGLGTATECRQKYTSDLLVNANLSAVLPLGDNQYEDGALSKYQQAYASTWGRVKGITRPVPGNHEYSSAGAQGYFDYFNGVGNATGPAGEPGKGYYSFRVGSWRLIALNSNCAQIGGCGAGSPQEQWLKAELARPAACTLAFWHHPRFSSGTHGSSTSMQAIWKDLYDQNADVVLSGHDHLYERFAPQTATGSLDFNRGIREFVVGTGGKSHYGFGTIRPYSEVRNSDTFGVLKLTLRPGAYEWQFVPEAGHSFTDSGTGYCH